MSGSKPRAETTFIPGAIAAAVGKGLSLRQAGQPAPGQIRAQDHDTRYRTPDILRPSILLTGGMKLGGGLSGRISFELR
jgi:hypothetical protein